MEALIFSDTLSYGVFLCLGIGSPISDDRERCISIFLATLRKGLFLDSCVVHRLLDDGPSDWFQADVVPALLKGGKLSLVTSIRGMKGFVPREKLIMVYGIVKGMGFRILPNCGMMGSDIDMSSGLTSSARNLFDDMTIRQWLMMETRLKGIRRFKIMIFCQTLRIRPRVLMKMMNMGSFSLDEVSINLMTGFLMIVIWVNQIFKILGEMDWTCNMFDELLKLRNMIKLLGAVLLPKKESFWSTWAICLYAWVSVIIGRSCDKNQEGLGRIALQAAGKLEGDGGKDVEFVSIESSVCAALQMAECNNEAQTGYNMSVVDGIVYVILAHKMSGFLNNVIAAEGPLYVKLKECVQILVVSSCAGNKVIDRETMSWAAKRNGTVSICVDTIGIATGIKCPQAGNLRSCCLIEGFGLLMMIADSVFEFGVLIDSQPDLGTEERNTMTISIWLSKVDDMGMVLIAGLCVKDNDVVSQHIGMQEHETMPTDVEMCGMRMRVMPMLDGRSRS